MSAEKGVTIAIVDEQPIVLRALESRLRAGGFVVEATARTAPDLLEFLRDHAVGVVVMGLPLREDGVSLIRAIRAAAPAVQVVVCNAADEGEPAIAFGAGASAFVEKSGHPDDIVTAVRQTVSRSIFLTPAARRRAAQAKGTPSLTPREREVVSAAADGGTNVEIASQLWITEQTVKYHLSNIYRKLGVANRTEMARYAQRHGLLAGEPRAVARNAGRQPRS